MSERYWITGVQLGIIKAQISNKTHLLELVKEIEDKQFIGNLELTDEWEIILRKKVDINGGIMR